MNLEEFTWRREELTDSLLAPVIKLFVKLGFPANHVSILAAVSVLFSAYCIHLKEWNAGIALLMISILLDLIDGGVSRMREEGNEYGHVFDSYLDYSFDTLILISFYSVNYLNFNTLLFTTGALFFHYITSTSYYLYTGKNLLQAPIGLRYFYIAFLLIKKAHVTNFITRIIGLIFLIESVHSFNELQKV